MSNPLRAWQFIGVALWSLGVLVIVGAVIYAPRLLAGPGTLGYVPQSARYGARAAHRIVSLEPGSPLAAAGVSAGDLIVAPPRGWLIPGDPVALKIVHEDRERTVEVLAVSEPYSSTINFTIGLESALGALALVLGTLLLLRRWRDPTALALAGVMFIGTTGLVAVQAPVGMLGAMLITWTAVALPLVLILLAWVALLMAPTESGAHRWVRRCSHGVAIAILIWGTLLAWYYSGNAIPATALFVMGVRTLLQAAALVLCVIAFVSTWRQVEAEQRERLRWVFVGLACIVGTAAITVGAQALGATQWNFLVSSLISDVLAALGIVALAYAVLGQRVLDVGFAINRAIVYAVLTGMMLIGFGVVEWLVDHVLEFEGRKQSVPLDGALALGIFLAFHRLQHWISHAVQHLFFRSWHARNEALDHFLAMSEHFTDPDALGKASLEALDLYAESKGSALYGRDSQGRLMLMQSTTPTARPAFGANDLEVMRLTASAGKPLLLGTRWFFPLTRRSKLVGFVAIDEKRSRDVYRPDQIERIVRAVKQVGFDLYTLRLEQTATRAVAAQRRIPGETTGQRLLPDRA